MVSVIVAYVEWRTRTRTSRLRDRAPPDCRVLGRAPLLRPRIRWQRCEHQAAPRAIARARRNRPAYALRIIGTAQGSNGNDVRRGHRVGPELSVTMHLITCPQIDITHQAPP